MTIAFQHYMHVGVQITNVAMSVLPAQIAFLCWLGNGDEVAPIAYVLGVSGTQGWASSGSPVCVLPLGTTVR